MIKMNLNNTHFITDRWPLEPSLPTIIFIHGAGSSKTFWKPLMQELNKDFNAIAFDLPGHGENSNDGMNSIEDYSRNIEECIRAINPPYPVPCGLSMGGAITLTLIINSDINFKAAIIINSGARLKVMPAIFELIKNNFRGYVDSITVMGSSAKTDPAKLKYITADSEQCSPDVTYDDFTACSNFDITEKLGSIHIPVLVLTAEEDKLTPQKHGKFLSDNITGSKHINIPDAGHFSPAEQPELIKDAIKEFLKKS